jgi:hypothetical protein
MVRLLMVHENDWRGQFVCDDWLGLPVKCCKNLISFLFRALITHFVEKYYSYLSLTVNIHDASRISTTTLL